MIVRCSFCGKSQNDVPRLVATEASTAAICTTCVMAVVDVLANDGEDSEPAFELTPFGREMAERIVGEAHR